jgi:rhamnosyl/mannosyltransferase
MAAGTPVISTDLGTGTTFINKDGETGLVVKAGNIDMLAAAIGKLLGDKNLKQRMGMAAKARAEQLFSEAVIIQHTLEVYKS